MAKSTKATKRELGLGIKALLQDYDSGPQNRRGDVVRELNAEPFRIPLDAVEANPFQPRGTFDEDELQELAASIRALDVIQPITVRRVAKDRYQLISGERRWRASKLAGLADIPAYVRTADDQGMIEMAIVENVQRSALNPVEVAIGYRRLIDEVGLTHEQLSERVGMRRSTVTNLLRLLKLAPEAQSALKEKRISAGHGRALAALVDQPALQLELLRAIERDGLSVRQAELRVKQLTEPRATVTQVPAAPLPPVVNGIQRELAASYGTRVRIRRDAGGRGQFVIPFGDDAEFNRILEQLRGPDATEA